MKSDKLKEVRQRVVDIFTPFGSGDQRPPPVFDLRKKVLEGIVVSPASGERLRVKILVKTSVIRRLMDHFGRVVFEMDEDLAIRITPGPQISLGNVMMALLLHDGAYHFSVSASRYPIKV